jgi:O-antigen/teichoic acid export membrane protein
MSESDSALSSDASRPPTSRFRRAFGTTAVVTGFGYASQLLSLVALPVYLTTLGPGGYGLMVTVMALMGYLAFADAGLSWGSMILIAQASGRDSRTEIAHVLRHSAVLAMGSGLVVLLALGVILSCAGHSWRLPMFAGHPEADRLTAIAGIQLAIILQFSVIYNLFNGLQEGYLTGIYQGLGRLLGVAGSMVVALRMRSVAGVMIVQFSFAIAGGVAALVHAYIRHRWAFEPGTFADPAQYKAQIRVGAKSFLLQIGRTLASTAPTFGISSVFGPAAVPLYTVPTTLLSTFFGPINTWNASMQSAYGEAWTSGSKAWTVNAFRKTLERALLFGGYGVALFLALGDPFIRLWTHNRLWLNPAMAASVTAIAIIGTLILGSEYLLTGLNRHRRASIAEIINGLVAMALVPLMARWMGMGSVGIAIAGAALFTSGWVLPIEIRSRLGPGCFPPISFFARVIGATAAAVAACAAAPQPGGDGFPGTVLRLLSGALIGSISYVAAVIALQLVSIGGIVSIGRRLTRLGPLQTKRA